MYWITPYFFCISPWNQELQSFQYDANDYKGLPFDFYGGYIGYIGYVADLCYILEFSCIMKTTFTYIYSCALYTKLIRIKVVNTSLDINKIFKCENLN